MLLDLLITTGPTGGHFFPGLAVAEHLSAAHPLLKVGFAVPDRPFIRAWMERKGFRAWYFPEIRLSLRHSARCAATLPQLVNQCLSVLRDARPPVIFATGSYACVPPALCGRLGGARLVLHEQNLFPGKATRLLAPMATAIGVTFAETRPGWSRKCVHTGFPIPVEFRVRTDREEALKMFGLRTERRTLLVMGGSQGARFLNEIGMASASTLNRMGWQVLHLAGPHTADVRSAYAAANLPSAVLSFCHTMGAAYAAADAVLCRAGAGTIAELCYHLLPAVVVPYPFAGRHQYQNAGYLQARGACVTMRQCPETMRLFPEALDRLWSQADGIRAALAKIPIPDTGQRMADIVLSAMPS